MQSIWNIKKDGETFCFVVSNLTNNLLSIEKEFNVNVCATGLVLDYFGRGLLDRSNYPVFSVPEFKKYMKKRNK